MTLVKFYVWFKQGFSEISQYIGIINTVLLFTAVLSLRGITIPLLLIPIAFIGIVIACIIYTYLFEKFGIWSKINSHFNRNQNPEFKEVVDGIRKLLEQKK